MEAWFWSCGVHILTYGIMLLGFYLWLFHTDHKPPKDYKLEALNDINKKLNEIKKTKCQNQ